MELFLEEGFQIAKEVQVERYSTELSLVMTVSDLGFEVVCSLHLKKLI